LETRTDHSVFLSSREMRVQIGDVCCSIFCPDSEIYTSLYRLYHNFLSDQPEDITLKINVVEQISTANIKSALSRGEFIRSEGRIVAIYRLSGKQSTTTNHTINLTAGKCYFGPQLGFKIMNLILPASYYAVVKLRHPDGLSAMLVHSCGIIRRGQVLLFAGPPETGKTTIARLCGDEHGQVVNDEMVLLSGVRPNSGRPMVQGIPIIGGIAQRLNVKAPLACVIMLKQDSKTAVRRLSRLEAYLRFMRQVIASWDYYAGYKDTKKIILQNTEFSDWVTKNVPFYELQFTLDREQLWRAVAELEGSFLKGEAVA
jgi:hypothetical protein